MYVTKTEDRSTFTFGIDGIAYSVPTLASMPMGDIVAFTEAATGGEAAAIRWVYDLFMRATEGAVAKLPGSAFSDLMREWQAAKAVEPGK